MGYYTRYEITANSDLRPVLKALAEVSPGYFGDGLAAAADSEDYSEKFISDSWKWYDHEQDLIRASLTLPNVTIRVVGAGEENGDHWCKFFLNGQIQRHQAPKWVPPAAPDLTRWSPK